MYPHPFFRRLACCGLAIVAASSDASDDSRPLEEIVVTADFRARDLMQSSGSISVLDRATLDERGATHLEQTLAVAPNVNFAVGGARARFVQMRGIGDLEQFVDPKHYPSVGILLDGIELANIASGAVLLDTEQVEILRGPQGTRFGASALAGMVNVRGRDPGDHFEAEVHGGYGNLDTWHVGGAAGGPLGKTLKARIAVRQQRSDGFIDNAFLGRDDTQDIDETAVRGRLLWDPLPGLSGDLTLLYLDADNGYDAFSLDNTRTTQSDQPGEDAQEVVALGGGLKRDLGRWGEAQLRATWTDGDETYGFDEDWVYRGFCDGVRCDPAFEFTSTDTMRRQRDQASVDLRWLAERGRFDWVTGAYYHHRDEDLRRDHFGAFTSAYETHRYALYGQLGVALNDVLTARLGVRGEAFDDDYADSFALATRSNDTYWSGDATLEYRPAATTLLYLTLARGAKPGGVNTGATSSLPLVDPRFRAFVGQRSRFDTETVFNKEIGLKGRYLDERLTVRLAAFHMDRSNAQLESWLWDANNFIFVGMLDNVDDAENYGVELESRLAVTRQVTFDVAVGYLETNVESMQVFDLDLNAFRTLRDRDQAKAPRWQYHFGLRWRPRDDLDAGIAVEGRDDSYIGYYHDARLDAWTVLNADVAWRWRDAELRVWARNLLNTEYAQHGLYFANDPRDGFAVNRRYLQFAEPRVYGVEINYEF